MNYSSAVMLINQNIRAIHVSYEKKDETKPNAPEPTRYTFKSLDQSLKVGDYVIIPTDSRHFMTVGRVEAVDVDVDFESDIQLKWIIDRVNREVHDTVLLEEGKWIEALKVAEKRRKREEIKKSLLDSYTDENGALPEMARIENLSAAINPAAPALEAANTTK